MKMVTFGLRRTRAGTDIVDAVVITATQNIAVRSYVGVAVKDIVERIGTVECSLPVPYSLCNHELHDPLGDVRLVAPSDARGRDREDLGRDIIGLSDLVPDLSSV